MVELPPLQPDEFDAFMRDAHDFEGALKWQRDLLERVMEKGWPDDIGVPTGFGKTTVVDIAVFILALQADMGPQERRARTRTFFCVDRRIVVDDVTRHAEQLASRLTQRSSPVLESVAERLNHISSRPVPGVEEPITLEHDPLTVTRMRGGVSWDARWIARIEQPAVVVGTVDQLASRLLFHGYGTSRRSLPIDAALVGTDALLILDEAHLAEPLRATISDLQRWERDDVTVPVLRHRRPHLVTMSATLRSGGANVFVVDRYAAMSDEETARRAAAARVGTLWDITDRPSRSTRERIDRLSEVLATGALRLMDREDVRVVGVVCNTVQTARTVHDRLASHGESELVIGPSRAIDRELQLRRLRPRAGVARSHAADAAPLFAVATQTIEVGVNLDFDALVTEAASLEALVQRLGRLDRLGRRTVRGLESPVLVVHSSALHADGQPHSVIYGHALERTWEHLTGAISAAEVRGSAKQGPSAAPLDGRLDLGLGGIEDLLSTLPDDRQHELFSEPGRVPARFPRELLLEWSQTSPRGRTSPAIEPFVRGDVSSQPTVAVVWRADIDGDASGEVLARRATDSVALRPITSQEAVEVPIGQVRAWLAGRASERPLADMPTGGENEPEGSPRLSRHAAVLQEDGTCRPLTTPRALRPGDTLVLPCSAGGLDRYGWNPSSREPAVDIADLCETRTGRVVRLWERTLAHLTADGSERIGEVISDVLGDVPVDVARLPATEASRLLTAIRQELGGPYGDLLGAWLGVFLKDLSAWQWVVERSPRLPTITDDVWVLRARRLSSRKKHELVDARRTTEPSAAAHITDEDDRTSLTGGRVALEDHVRAVASRAMASARRLGVPDRLVDAVGEAAIWHDRGKIDPRFQVMLRGGDPIDYLPGDIPLAKSGMDSGDRWAYRRACEASGWPAGMRHEALSVALYDAWQADHQDGADDIDLDLVRHLIASHHGFGRPLLPGRLPQDLTPLELSLESGVVKTDVDQLSLYLPDWGAPGRFRKLTERYGAWGLALLETVVRLADMNCSEAGT